MNEGNNFNNGVNNNFNNAPVGQNGMNQGPNNFNNNMNLNNYNGGMPNGGVNNNFNNASAGQNGMNQGPSNFNNNMNSNNYNGGMPNGGVNNNFNNAPVGQNGMNQGPNNFNNMNPNNFNNRAMAHPMPNNNFNGNNKKSNALLFVIIGVVAFVLIMTGVYFVFGNKTLKCTITESQVDLVYVSKFAFNNFIDAKVSASVDISEFKNNKEFMNNKDTFIDSFKKNITSEFKGVEATAKEVGDKIIVEYSLNRDYLKKEGYNIDSYKDMKVDFENQGFTCK